MEFIVQKADLLREMARVQGVVERKNTMPILSNALLRAADGRIELQATDLEVGLRTSCPAEVKSPGAITLSARKLFEITRALPDAPVRFQDQPNHWVSVDCENSHFRIVGLPKDDFPVLAEATLDEGVRIPGATFRSMIERVIFATTADDARYSLNGALLVLRSSFLALVASDGHRLAYISREVPIKPKASEVRVVVPRKAIAEVARLCAELDEEVAFGQHENRLFFKIGGTTLDSRVLEGNFPKFEKVIPKDNDKDLEIETGIFGGAMRRVSLVSDERARPVKVSLARGKMEISSNNPETGEAKESLSIEYEGPEMEIGFNARYLLEFLSAVGVEKLILSLKDEMSQAVLRPKNGDGQDYRYVVMPMRL